MRRRIYYWTFLIIIGLIAYITYEKIFSKKDNCIETKILPIDNSIDSIKVSNDTVKKINKNGK